MKNTKIKGSSTNVQIRALLEALKEEDDADIVFKKEDPKLYYAAKRAKKSNKNVITKDGPGSGEDDSVLVKKGTKASDLEEMSELMSLASEKDLVEALRKSIRAARRR
jgi:hypothetical protein